MKDKPIRKMNREELLEMLIRYTELNEELNSRVAQLESQLSEAKKKLEERTITASRAGSIAEAAMQLSGVFDAAQLAADQYLESIRKMYPEENAGIPSKECQTHPERMVEYAEHGQAESPLSAQGMTRRRKRGMGL